MNRTIDRLKLIFLGLFIVLSAGTLVYHVGWVWPGQKCEEAGDWWDWRSRTCASPILISDIPGVRYTEGRFLPYFFPDVFNPEGDPIGEAVVSWAQARRAIVRKAGCGRPQLLGRVADLANLHGRARTVVQADLQLRRSYRVSGWTSS